MELREVAAEICRDEYRAYTVYKSLSSSRMLPEKAREAFRRFSEEEYRHYLYWRGIAGECVSPVSKLSKALYILLLLLFGATVTLKVLERGERDSRARYAELRRAGLPEKELGDIEREEEEHESLLINSIDEGRVRYLSSIALGVSDALIELTGIYMGSLGLFAAASSVGLVGLIAGISASISMGAASYSQAKHAGTAKPFISALYTMGAYLLVALSLALPYFALPSLAHSFALMMLIAIAIISYMSFYASVLHDRSFVRELAENLGLIIGVGVALYFLGSGLRSVIPFVGD